MAEARRDKCNEHLVDFGVEGQAAGAAVLTLWVECEMPLQVARLLYVPLFEDLAAHTDVKSTPGLQSAIALPPSKQHKTPVVQTAGVNFGVLSELADVVDLPNVRSNHIHAVLNFYGVEAARSCIVHEIASVFGVYGISVDPRHLGLIADYMTHEGGYKALNRHGMYAEPSPLLKMTYETTMGFLSDAARHGDVDTLNTPSASIVLGKPPKCGTGAFELLANLPLPDGAAA